MFKLVKGMAIFLMLVGMITTAFAEFDANKNEVIPEVVKVEFSTKPVEKRYEQVNIQKLTIDDNDVAEATAPILLDTTLEVEYIPQETSPLGREEEIIVAETQSAAEEEKKNPYHTGVLTARKGYITDSPCGPNGNDGYETWYPTHPGGAVKILEKQCGFTNLKMEVCREEGPRYGVRIISGTMPNGESFEDLVVVAADIKCTSNPSGAFERGQLIQTSLGPGIIVDFCERAVNERKYNGRTHIDIATDWYN